MTVERLHDPATVGPYRLVQRLGEGGMGVVHLALDPTGQQVALKLLRSHVADDPEARRRLMREVQTLRRVRHARVAEVLDADLVGRVPYLVTRFVPGRTLDQFVRDHGALTADHAIRVARGLAGALEAIHRVGVVHRDIKPANVMLVDGEPVLIDFGIAHLADESRITATGLVMGTPGYLSPEVAGGQPVTAATDWWGWAATVAFAANGRPPFGSGMIEIVLDRVRRGAADLQGMDPRLESALRAALTVDPARRAQPAQVLAWLGVSMPSAGPTPRTGTATPTHHPAAPPATRPAPPVTRPAPPATRPAPPATRPAAPPATRPAAPPVARPASPPAARAAGPTTPYPAGASGFAQPNPYASRPPAGADYRAPVPGGGPTPSGAPMPGQAPPAGAPLPDRVQPHRPTWTLLAAATALSAVAAVAPGGAIVIAFLAMVLARTFDRTSSAIWRRRQTGGPRPADVPVAVITLPWRLVEAIVASLLALVLPMLVGASVAFMAAAAAQGTSGATPDLPGVLFVAAAAAVGTAWWGPGGASFRRGGRAAARAVHRTQETRIGVWVFLGLVVLSGMIVAGQGAAPSWAPFGPAWGSGY